MIITLENVSKNYNSIVAADGVSIGIREGEALALVGPNGSGKTTLLKIMLGITQPSSGRVLVRGEELTEKSWREFKSSLGYMPERVSFYDNLTGMETLKLFARVLGGSVDEIGNVAERILADDILNRRVGTYSKGMRQRLNLAQALLNEPEILVLDEPTSGLDPIGTKEFYDILEEVRGLRKLTVILSSHILAEIEEKTDRIAIMKNGSLVAIGRLEELYTGMNIPLRITLKTGARDEVLEEILRKEGATDLAYSNGYLVVSVASERKLATISTIMEQKDRFIDISIREPSLEEVFFGVH
ncbi:MAG: ABC transporter ATP-binding protein [bacterium]